MKIPKSPPEFVQMIKKMAEFKDEPEKMATLLLLSGTLNSAGEYRHWDQLRHRPLPEEFPENSTLEDFWWVIKVNRNATKKILSFYSKEKNQSLFSFSRPDCLLASLRHIDLKAGGTIVSGKEKIGKQDGQRYLTRSLIEEPFSSSVLEGAATTRQKAQALIEKNELPRTKDEQMVLNNYRAMLFMKEHKNEPLTPSLILECHRIITEKTLERPEMAGVLRDNNEVFVGDNYGEIFHIPPDFSELETRLQNLCDFANQFEGDGTPYIHPVIRAIILHFMLAYDHPFIDGNGRTARALFYWSVLRSGYWIMEYISISKIIKEAPTKYGMAFLYTETDENDVTYFIMHQLNVLKKAITELEAYLDRQKYKYKQIDSLLSKQSFNRRQSYLLGEFIRNRLRNITIIQHQRVHGVSYLTARKDFEDLERDGWLKKKVKGRTYIYTAGRKLDELR